MKNGSDDGVSAASARHGKQKSLSMAGPAGRTPPGDGSEVPSRSVSSEPGGALPAEPSPDPDQHPDQEAAAKADVLATFEAAIAYTRDRSPASFDQWFSSVQFDALDDGVLSLRARDEFTREWVEDHFLPTLTDRIREATGWSDTQLKVHLGRLLELEYLIVRRGLDGQHAARFVYELVYDGEGQDGAAFLMGLIDIEGLAAEQAANEMSYDGNRSGPGEDRPGSGRPMVGPRSGGGRGAEHPEKPSPAKPLTDPTAPPPETARLGRNGAAVIAAAGSYV